MTDLADACWHAVDETTSEAVVIVGSSVGAQVALHMTHRQPNRTQAMILSGMVYPPNKTLRNWLYQRAEAYTRQGIAFRRGHASSNFSSAFLQTPLGPYLVNMFLERDDHADAVSIARMYRAAAVDTEEGIYGAAAPMLIIAGSEDPAYEGALALQARLRCELAVLDGAGHAAHMEQPWAWDRVALGFLNRQGIGPDLGGHARHDVHR